MFSNWLAKRKFSLWMIIFSEIITATMMHPSIAAMIVLIVNLPLLCVARWVAHLEGKSHVRN